MRTLLLHVGNWFQWTPKLPSKALRCFYLLDVFPSVNNKQQTSSHKKLCSHQEVFPWATLFTEKLPNIAVAPSFLAFCTPNTQAFAILCNRHRKIDRKVIASPPYSVQGSVSLSDAHSWPLSSTLRSHAVFPGFIFGSHTRPASNAVHSGPQHQAFSLSTSVYRAVLWDYSSLSASRAHSIP